MKIVRKVLVTVLALLVLVVFASYVEIKFLVWRLGQKNHREKVSR